MPAADTALSFFGIAIVLALTPGPDNIFVLTQSALHGRLSGLLVVLGLCTGLVGHTAAVAVGVAAIFAASPLAFTVLKLGGAAYLLYLAWLSFRTGGAKTGPCVGKQQPPALFAMYRRGIIMNLSNPKVSLFFLAFLPQFTTPARGSIATQSLWLGALFMLATLIVFGLIAVAGGMAGERLQRSPAIGRVMNRLAGLIFIGLALRLAAGQRN